MLINIDLKLVGDVTEHNTSATKTDGREVIFLLETEFSILIIALSVRLLIHVVVCYNVAFFKHFKY